LKSARVKINIKFTLLNSAKGGPAELVFNRVNPNMLRFIHYDNLNIVFKSQVVEHALGVFFVFYELRIRQLAEYESTKIRTESDLT
jgi:hypothetical protein